MPFFQHLFDTSPLDLTHVLVSVAAGIFVLLFVEVEKLVFRRVFKAGEPVNDVGGLTEITLAAALGCARRPAEKPATSPARSPIQPTARRL